MAAVHPSPSPVPTRNLSILRPSSSSSTSVIIGGTRQDRQDLEKFSRFFTIKAIQIIVQSRLGEKMEIQSRPSSTDWFNLAVQDNMEILQQTKSVIGTNASSLPTCVIVEISLNKPDGDGTNPQRLILELWKLYFTNDSSNEQLSTNQQQQRPRRTLYTVYNSMSLLLKSLITISRVLPAYKLSRAKGNEFLIDYKIYSVDNHTSKNSSASNDYYCSSLGSEFKKNVLGSVVTQYGSIFVDFAYRTSMDSSFAPQSSISMENDLNETHYNLENTHDHQPQNGVTQSCPPSANKCKVPAFSDPLPPIPQTFDYTGFTSTSTVSTKNRSRHNSELQESNNNDGVEVADDIPFSNLLKKSISSANGGGGAYSKYSFRSATNSRKASLTDTAIENGGDKHCSNNNIDLLPSCSTSTINMSDTSGSFEFLSIKPLPFAPSSSTDTSSSDPTAFFNSLQNPPILQSLEKPSASSTVDLARQINGFEQNLHIFDDFVKRVCIEV